jgi:hypothetical protein
MHLAVASDNEAVIAAIDKALEYDSVNRRGDARPILIDTAIPFAEPFKKVKHIIIEARRRAEAVRSMRCASIGVAMASGRTEVAQPGKGRRILFNLHFLVAVVPGGGVVGYSVPDLYTPQLCTLLKEQAEDTLPLVPPTLIDIDTTIRSGIALQTWSKLQFPDVGEEHRTVD